MRDLMNNITTKVVIAPAGRCHHGQHGPGRVDRRCRRLRSFTFVISIGSLADSDATFAVLVEEGAAANLSDAVAVDDKDLIGTGDARRLHLRIRRRGAEDRLQGRQAVCALNRYAVRQHGRGPVFRRGHPRPSEPRADGQSPDLTDAEAQRGGRKTDRSPVVLIGGQNGRTGESVGAAERACLG